MNPPSQDLRQRRADATRGVTRRAVLQAARALFTESGYANTPIRRIAEEAGVAVQTIYATFGSKPAVLVGLLELVDQETVAPLAAQLANTEDAGQVLDLTAKLQRHVRESAGELMRLVVQGAAMDPEVSKVWEEGFDRHRQGITRVCEQLAKSRSLRKGLSVEDATATALALTSLEAYEEAVRHAGWSHDRYEQWLSAALRAALLKG